MRDEKEEEVEEWLQLLCFLSTLILDERYRTHFTELLVRF
jgi:hypothetical protein